MILLGALAGLRVHEIARVHTNDIDQAHGIITVTGKGGTTWALPLHEQLLKLASKPRGYWFPSPIKIGQPVSNNYVYKRIKSILVKAGLSEATPHQLRHSYGTELLRRGADIRTVQELMRHIHLNTTQIYTEVQWRSKSEAIRTLTLLS